MIHYILIYKHINNHIFSNWICNNVFKVKYGAYFLDKFFPFFYYLFVTHLRVINYFFIL